MRKCAICNDPLGATSAVTEAVPWAQLSWVVGTTTPAIPPNQQVLAFTTLKLSTTEPPEAGSTHWLRVVFVIRATGGAWRGVLVPCAMLVPPINDIASALIAANDARTPTDERLGIKVMRRVATRNPVLGILTLQITTFFAFDNTPHSGPEEKACQDGRTRDPGRNVPLRR